MRKARVEAGRGRPLVGGGLLALLAVASPAGAASLDEAVRRALARSPEVEAARAEADLARTEVSIARNGYLPSLTASTGPAGDGVGYDVTLSQTVYDFGQVRGAVDQRRALAEQKRANLEVVRDNEALEVVEVYLDIANKRIQIALLETHLKRLATLTETAQARVEGRYADEAEIARVRLAVAGAEADRARLQGELADAMDQYRLLVDEAPNGVQLPPLPTFLDRLKTQAGLEAAIADSPLYRRAAMGIRAATAGVREAEAARWPRVALEGSLQRREIGGELIDDSVIALRLRLSPQQGLASFQRPQLERQRVRAAEMGADAVARDLRRIVSSLRTLDEALKGRIDAFSDQSQQSDAVRALYREQFLVGRREVQDLVVMETEHNSAERQVVELTIERLRLQYRAAAQLGLLAEAFAGGAAE